MNKSDVIIPRSAPRVHETRWQSQLSGAIDNLSDLLRATGNDDAAAQHLTARYFDFPVRVPHAYLARIKPGDINDPLLKQVLPLAQESLTVPGYTTDPLEESATTVVPGIIHKYSRRVLLILTGACAINCRYCFRRHFPYQDNNNSLEQWSRALGYIRDDPSITEVIFSGGDPLANSDKRLATLTRQIAAIPHVKRLRIHTRLPIVIPDRINAELIRWLTETRLQVSMVLHSNHPNELDQQVAAALAKLRPHPITLLNQSVLLKGINDSSATLAALSERLYEMGVLPYYLHLMDKVQGAAHFDVEIEQARKLAGELAARLPGYLTPKLAIEQPGKASKTLLSAIEP